MVSLKYERAYIRPPNRGANMAIKNNIDSNNYHTTNAFVIERRMTI